jgi:hypothetical protein
MTLGVATLSVDDVAILTGRMHRRQQCEALSAMGIPFARNLVGYPFVPLSFIDGEAARGRREAKEIQEEFDRRLQKLMDDNARAARNRRK